MSASTRAMPMLDKMKSMISKFAVIFGGLVDLVLIGNAFLGIQRRTIWPALPYPVPISPNNACLELRRARPN
jgi:hypothetical protein